MHTQDLARVQIAAQRKLLCYKRSVSEHWNSWIAVAAESDDYLRAWVADVLEWSAPWAPDEETAAWEACPRAEFLMSALGVDYSDTLLIHSSLHVLRQLSPQLDPSCAGVMSDVEGTLVDVLEQRLEYVYENFEKCGDRAFSIGSDGDALTRAAMDTVAAVCTVGQQTDPAAGCEMAQSAARAFALAGDSDATTASQRLAVELREQQWPTEPTTASDSLLEWDSPVWRSATTRASTQPTTIVARLRQRSATHRVLQQCAVSSLEASAVAAVIVHSPDAEAEIIAALVRWRGARG